MVPLMGSGGGGAGNGLCLRTAAPQGKARFDPMDQEQMRPRGRRAQLSRGCLYP